MNLLGFAFLVALFTRAWIEIINPERSILDGRVALFTRAWIEIMIFVCSYSPDVGRPLHEGVD